MATIKRRSRPLLGTFVEIGLRDGNPAIFTAAFAEVERVHHLMSAHLVDSDLGKIARKAHHGWVRVDAATAEVIQITLKLAELTEGAFDPIRAGCALIHAGRRPCLADHPPDPKANWTDLELKNGKVRSSRPLAIDLGGIAKGYAVDLATEIITGYGCTGVINVGGDLRFTGDEKRTISLRKPVAEGARFDLQEIPYPALATTASYAFSEDGGNLDLITTKLPPAGISITVFARNCTLADALTKAVLNLPTIKATEILRQLGCSALILTADGGFHELL